MVELVCIVAKFRKSQR